MNLKRSQRMQKLVDIETQQSQPVVAKFKADQIALQQQEQALQNLHSLTTFQIHPLTFPVNF